MDILSAGRYVRDLIEADDVQYSPAIQLLHINEALSELAREYEVRMNEFVAEFTWPANATEINMLDYISDDQLQIEVVRYIFSDPADTNVELVEGELDEVFRFYGDEAGTPCVFAQYGKKLYIRPVPDEDITLRVLCYGYPVFLNSGENEWLRIAPFAAIYRACELACIYKVEDARAPIFKTMRIEHMEKVNLADSSRNDGPRVSEDI